MLIRHRLSQFVNPVLISRVALWADGMMVRKHRNVLAVLGTPGGKLLVPAANIVTSAGDIYYSQRGAGETPDNAFGIHELASAGTPGKAATRASFTMIGSTQKAHAATYPMSDDQDADNTGAGVNVITYKASYAKTDFSDSAISHGVVTNVAAGVSEPLLTGYAFDVPFAKELTDTLVIFCNHSMLGE